MAFTKCDCLILYKGANNADRRLLLRCKGGEMPRQPDNSGDMHAHRPAQEDMERHPEKH